MQSDERNVVVLQTVATILIRSFLFGLALLVLWFTLCLIVPGWLFQVNSKWFNIGQRDFELINYCGMGVLKMAIIIFFLLPYLAIKSMLGKKEGRS